MTWMQRLSRYQTGLLVTAGVAAAAMSAWAVTTFMPSADTEMDVAALSPPVTEAVPRAGASLGDIERGRVYYIQVCVPCHGIRGDGMGEWAYRINPEPADLTRARTRSRSDAELYRIVTDGIPGTAMIGWRRQLSDAQREQVIAYVRHLGRHRGRAHE